MSIFTVGRLCVKIAGRDAGRRCVVVEQFDNNFVLVDGNVRRKKVNIKHLEPLSDMIEIRAKAGHVDVTKAFEKLGLAFWDRKSKTPAAKPNKVRKVKEAKPVKKAAKKTTLKVKESKEAKEAKEAKEEAVTQAKQEETEIEE